MQIVNQTNINKQRPGTLRRNEPYQHGDETQATSKVGHKPVNPLRVQKMTITDQCVVRSCSDPGIRILDCTDLEDYESTKITLHPMKCCMDPMDSTRRRAEPGCRGFL